MNRIVSLLFSIEIQVKRQSPNVQWILAACRTVLSQIKSVQHQAVLERKLNAERILVLVPRMILAIPE